MTDGRSRLAVSASPKWLSAGFTAGLIPIESLEDA